MPNIFSRLAQAVRESRDRVTKRVNESGPVTTARQYRSWWRERPGSKHRTSRGDTPPEQPAFPYPPVLPRPQSPAARPSNRLQATPSTSRGPRVAYVERRSWRRYLSVRNPWLVMAIAAGIGYALVYRANPVLGQHLAQQAGVLAAWVLQDILHYPWLVIVLAGAWAIDHFVTGGSWLFRIVLGIMVVALFRVPAQILKLLPLLLFAAQWVYQDLVHYPWLLGIVAIAVAAFAFLNKWRVRGKLGFLTRSTVLYGLLLFMLNPTAPQGVILDRLLWWPVWLVIVWLGWRLALLFRSLGFRFFVPFD